MKELKNMVKNVSTFTTDVVIDNDGIKVSVLDIMIAKFPHIAIDIFKELDNETLTNCRKVSRLWCGHLDNQRIYWVRMIQRYSMNMKSSYHQWKKVFKNTPVEYIKDLSVSIQQFVKDDALRSYFQMFPLHVVADQGNLELCKYIFEKTKDIKLSTRNNWTALHMAAFKGYKEVFEFLMHNSKKKNPSNEKGMTPLHYAAERGFTNICKLIIANVDKKNPASHDGCTPLHLAAREGHLAIIRLIVETGVDKNSLWCGETPLQSLSNCRSYNFYKLLTNDKTQLCGKLFQDLMIYFVIYTVILSVLNLVNLFYLVFWCEYCELDFEAGDKEFLNRLKFGLIICSVIDFPLTIMVRVWLYFLGPYNYRPP